MTARIVLLAAALAVASTAAQAQPQITVLTSNDPKLALGKASFPGGRQDVSYTVGVGSGAFRAKAAPAWEIWTVGDRGPNFTCEEGEKPTGLKAEVICAANKGTGRLYPMPSYSPSIYRLVLDPQARRFAVAEAIPLKKQDGTPINGLLNPLKTATTEQAMGADGKLLAHDPSALDVEGIVRLADGTFWIGEENAPSIVQVGADGRVIRRLVPQGTEGELAGAGYPVEGRLPALLARRFTNRGIESMALSPDERFLYFIMQNPIGNPNADTYRDARAARLYKLDRATLRIEGEWAYEMDPVKNYPGERDNARNSVVRISELTALGTDRLLVLERTEKVTRIYEVKLADGTNIAGSKWDDAATAPSLEQTADLAAAGVKSLAKTLRLDTAAHPEIPTKIEGVAVMGDGRLMIINDDDFGIDGGTTSIILISGTGVALD